MNIILFPIFAFAVILLLIIVGRRQSRELWARQKEANERWELTLRRQDRLAALLVKVGP